MLFLYFVGDVMFMLSYEANSVISSLFMQIKVGKEEHLIYRNLPHDKIKYISLSFSCYESKITENIHMVHFHYYSYFNYR